MSGKCRYMLQLLLPASSSVHTLQKHQRTRREKHKIDEVISSSSAGTYREFDALDLLLQRIPIGLALGHGLLRNASNTAGHRVRFFLRFVNDRRRALQQFFRSLGRCRRQAYSAGGWRVKLLTVLGTAHENGLLERVASLNGAVGMMRVLTNSKRFEFYKTFSLFQTSCPPLRTPSRSTTQDPSRQGVCTSPVKPKFVQQLNPITAHHP
jgi:hypothetical protein